MALSAVQASAEPKYDPGASDTEIRIGNINPYSGPAAAYGVIGRTIAAYFEMVNAAGGINGRKVTFLSYDDGYSPAKTLEQARRLVEQDQVLLIFQSLGAAANLAIRDYMNRQQVPQLFVASPASSFDDPKNYPWTMGYQPNTATEGRLFGRYILETVAEPRIAILFQNDEFGREFMDGLKAGLDGRGEILAEAPYEVSDPTVDNQMIALAGTGANVFVSIATPKFAAQAIRKAAEIGWRPLQLMSSVSASVSNVMRPAGLEAATGVVSLTYLKDAMDPRWHQDEDYRVWEAFMDRWFPEGQKTDSFTVYGYTVAAVLAEVLRRCGDDLTRENVMHQATSLEGLVAPMLLPGMTVETGPDDYRPLEQAEMVRFNGTSFEPISALQTAGQ